MCVRRGRVRMRQQGEGLGTSPVAFFVHVLTQQADTSCVPVTTLSPLLSHSPVTLWESTVPNMMVGPDFLLWILAPPRRSCVTLGKLLNLSESWFLSQQNGVNNSRTR